MLRKFVAPLLAMAIVAGGFTVLAGCNTMAGAGEDIQRGGAAIERKAKQ
jgi:predicted small secreted protein